MYNLHGCIDIMAVACINVKLYNNMIAFSKCMGVKRL